MRPLLILGFWVFLGSSFVVTIVRYFHPATLSVAIFPTLVALACISGAAAIVRKRYE